MIHSHFLLLLLNYTIFLSCLVLKNGYINLFNFLESFKSNGSLRDVIRLETQGGEILLPTSTLGLNLRAAQRRPCRL